MLALVTGDIVIEPSVVLVVESYSVPSPVSISKVGSLFLYFRMVTRMVGGDHVIFGIPNYHANLEHGLEKGTSSPYRLLQRFSANWSSSL
jgi:hypothetical protein